MKKIILALALSALSTTVFSKDLSLCTVQCLVTNNMSRESVVTLVTGVSSSLEEAKAQIKARCSTTDSDKKQIIASEILNENGNRFYNKTATVLDSQCSSVHL
ncbi:hypothetical protein SHI21_18475 [Bacteriovorax sp. PP10]|uniref:Lipoprotein n=1 Tax=Bacteriovorax antarcticus TaxID=3088717 RepID=A0ABU5VZ28_9BACT|nr:hypothetical protein [Bacteriovorax sp. PP10]MEA9358227.1 hypothetical protein [Bacteriovorax sp. PP10]